MKDLARMTLFIVTVIIYSCATPSILTPPVGPGTDRPCDYVHNGNIVSGHGCANHMCCDDGNQCGGPPPNSCAPGYCCFIGSDGTFGAKKPTKQFPDHT